MQGHLFGTVVDLKDLALPNVTITLSGNDGAPQVQLTNASGQVRYLDLTPGRYDVKAEREGYATVHESGVMINVGRTTSILITLQPA